MGCEGNFSVPEPTVLDTMYGLFLMKVDTAQQ